VSIKPGQAQTAFPVAASRPWRPPKKVQKVRLPKSPGPATNFTTMKTIFASLTLAAFVCVSTLQAGEGSTCSQAKTCSATAKVCEQAKTCSASAKTCDSAKAASCEKMAKRAMSPKGAQLLAKR
jgi:hypothetical protein